MEEFVGTQTSLTRRTLDNWKKNELNSGRTLIIFEKEGIHPWDRMSIYGFAHA